MVAPKQDPSPPGAAFGAAPRTPLIVSGFPRSGTWMCAHLLANSPEVELQGEMPRGDEVLAFLEGMKAHYAGQPADRRARWEAKAHELAFDVFAGVSATASARRPGARYAGHKTPRHERWFDRYEALFDHPAARPRHVYCLRNPWAVWRSHRVMPWNRLERVEDFIRAWTGSVGCWERMHDRAGERALLFRLDEMTADPAQAGAVVERTLLAPLGLDPARLIQPVGAVRNTNSAGQKLGAEPPPLDARDIDRIAGDRRVRDLLSRWLPEATPPEAAAQAPRRGGWLDRLRG